MINTLKRTERYEKKLGIDDTTHSSQCSDVYEVISNPPSTDPLENTTTDYKPSFKKAKRQVKKVNPIKVRSNSNNELMIKKNPKKTPIQCRKVQTKKEEDSSEEISDQNKETTSSDKNSESERSSNEESSRSTQSSSETSSKSDETGITPPFTITSKNDIKQKKKEQAKKSVKSKKRVKTTKKGVKKKSVPKRKKEDSKNIKTPNVFEVLKPKPRRKETALDLTTKMLTRSTSPSKIKENVIKSVMRQTIDPKDSTTMNKDSSQQNFDFSDDEKKNDKIERGYTDKNKQTSVSATISSESDSEDLNQNIVPYDGEDEKQIEEEMNRRLEDLAQMVCGRMSQQKLEFGMEEEELIGSEYLEPKVFEEYHSFEDDEGVEKKVKICFSGFDDEEIKAYQKRLWGLRFIQIVNNVRGSTTHLIVKGYVRTKKVILAMCTGCWVLNSLWIDKCIEKGKIVKEDLYKQMIGERGNGEGVVLDIFKGYTMWVKTFENSKFVEKIIKMSGGVLDRSALFVVGTEEGEVTKEWIYDSVCDGMVHLMDEYVQ
ncbi:hypothetical protein EIN_084170 [Entamoeba invadens IP1]|uniref:hypothetical protein n=1 Tax=Entamoeba invadens IP1 TaxID=370355 RepID=UPI0002C3E828|nr:hypothetical protein EIN_084170 [Entamoeba invadens IP1]ELP85255.1 hypothetical protein EIN_084170 [Entamoeba invadens IP1]|eukprot:XP_004184601.1 hypothetical protein EIN_084170 [Entamoeba invadens IP1]